MNVPAIRLDALGVDAISVGTDGTTAAVEQARTLLENAQPTPAQRAVHHGRQGRGGQPQQRLPAARERGDPGQPADRRLHARHGHRGRALGSQAAVQPAPAAGARLSTLRRVVALEGAVPLLSVAAVAIGTGFAGAAMFATEAQQHPMVAPALRTTC